jgi:hypothetical protein
MNATRIPDDNLPPLPVTHYIERNPDSTEYGLWCKQEGPYSADDMREYARAAIAKLAEVA